MVKPETGQANFAEKMIRSRSRSPHPVPLPVGERGRCGTALILPLPLGERAGVRGPSVGELGDDDAVGEMQRRLEAIGEPRRQLGTHHDAVHHHVDIVLDVLVERRHLGDLVEAPVDLHPLEALLLQLGEVFAVLALAPARDRREQIEPRAFGQRQHPVDHLAHGLALDRKPRGRRIGHTHPGEQEPHIVVDLGDRADGRARVARGRLLLDGDGRRQALDMVHVRLLHHVEELPGIGRQRLDIAPLALGIDGVEGERGLAGARQSGDHHELFAGQVERDVLEIVLARATDGDEFGGHSLGNVGVKAARARLSPEEAEPQGEGAQTLG